MTVEVQHTMQVRIPIVTESGRKTAQIVTVNCPPFASDETLDRYLATYRAANPNAVVISRSWKSRA